MFKKLKSKKDKQRIVDGLKDEQSALQEINLEQRRVIDFIQNHRYALGQINLDLKDKITYLESRIIDEETKSKNAKQNLSKKEKQYSQIIERLQNQRDALEQNNQDMKDKITNLESRIIDEEKKNKNTELLLVKTKQNLSKKEEQYSQIVDSLKGEKSALEEINLEQRMISAFMNNHRYTLGQSNLDLKDNITYLKICIIDEKDNKKNAALLLDNTQKDLSQKKEQCTLEVEARQRAAEMKKYLHSKLKELKQEMKNEQEMTEQYKRKMQEASTQLEKEQEMTAQYKRKMQEASTQLEKEQEMTAQFKRKMQEATSQFEKEQEMTAQFKRKMQEATSQFEKEQEMTAQYKREMQEASTQLEKEHEMTAQYRREMQEASTQLEKEQEMIAQYKRKMQEEPTQLEKEQEMTAQLERQLQEQSAQLEEEKKWNKETEIILTKLQAEQYRYQNLDEEVAKLKSALKVSKKKLKLSSGEKKTEMESSKKEEAHKEQEMDAQLVKQLQERTAELIEARMWTDTTLKQFEIVVVKLEEEQYRCQILEGEVAKLKSDVKVADERLEQAMTTLSRNDLGSTNFENQ